MLFLVFEIRERSYPGVIYRHHLVLESTGGRALRLAPVHQYDLPSLLHTLVEAPLMRPPQRSCHSNLCLPLSSSHLQIKCDQYWPSRGTETYGMTQVTLLDTIELATFCVRTFSLHKVGGFTSPPHALKQRYSLSFSFKIIQIMTDNIIMQCLPRKQDANSGQMPCKDYEIEKNNGINVLFSKEKGRSVDPFVLVVLPLSPLLPRAALSLLNRSSVYVHLPNWST